MDEILNSNNAKVMKALLVLGPGSRADHISLVAKVSEPTAYRSLEHLIEGGVVGRTQGASYLLKEESDFVKSFSEAWDNERKALLSKETRREAIDITEQVRNKLRDRLVSVVLFGSSAAGLRGEKSDIDVLVVTSEKGRVGGLVESYLASVTVVTAEEFKAMWYEGSDLARSSASRGILLHDARGFMYRYRISPRVPITDAALVKAGKDLKERLGMFYEYVVIKDWQMALAFKNMIGGLIGRIALMGLDVFPRSRPEIPGQLERTGFSRLGEMVEEIYRFQEGDIEEGIDELGSSLEKANEYLFMLERDYSLFNALKTILWGDVKKASSGLSLALEAAGLTVTRGGRSDLFIEYEGNTAQVEVKTSKQRINKLFLKRVMQKGATVVYGPYREIPPDERSYKVPDEVARGARERGIKLVPSREVFSVLCDTAAKRRGPQDVMSVLVAGVDGAGAGLL